MQTLKAFCFLKKKPLTNCATENSETCEDVVRQEGGPLLARRDRVQVGEERDGVLCEKQNHRAEADPGMQGV